jgi:hypothetical protein
MQYEIKFDKLKAKAKAEFAAMMQNWMWNKNTFDLLLSFVLMSKHEREEIRAFADAFEGKRYDFLAGLAKSEHNPFAQMLLMAREQGLDIVEKWDVRKVSKLVEAFPNIVPVRFRDLSSAKVAADLVDNDAGDDCDWVVYFEKAPAIVS